MEVMNSEQRLPVRCRMIRPIWAIGFGLLLALAASAVRAQEASISGLERFEVPATGSYFLRYVPPDLPADRPAPVVVFFHGSGGKPENYESFVLGPARTAGCIR